MFLSTQAITQQRIIITIVYVGLNSGDADWLLVKHLGNGQKGYIPRNYIVVDDNSKESQE